MCEPTTLMIAATAMAATGELVKGVGAANSYRAQAKVQDMNARLDQANAQDALSRGRIEEARMGTKTGQLVGEQRAAMAGNGIEADYGTAADITSDTRNIGFEDAQTIRQNAARESKGYEINAWNARAGAAASRSAASSTLWSTAFGVGGTLLSGATQYAKMKVPSSLGNPAGYEFGPAG